MRSWSSGRCALRIEKPPCDLPESSRSCVSVTPAQIGRRASVEPPFGSAAPLSHAREQARSERQARTATSRSPPYSPCIPCVNGRTGEDEREREVILLAARESPEPIQNIPLHAQGNLHAHATKRCEMMTGRNRVSGDPNV